MKRNSRITSIRSTAVFQELLLEKYVNSNPPGIPVKVHGESRKAYFSKGYHSIQCCFARVPVNGSVEIDYNAGFFCTPKSMNVPVSSLFIVTCTKDSSGKFKSTWSCSLS